VEAPGRVAGRRTEEGAGTRGYTRSIW